MFSPFQPFLYLYVYMAMLYVRPHEFIPAFQVLPLLPMLLVSSFVFWAFRQPKSFEAPQFKLLPVLLVMMMISLVVAGWMGGAVALLPNFGPILLLAVMIATSLDSIAKFRAVFWLLSLASMMMALHGIGQSQAGIGWTGAKAIEGRITYLGFVNDPNDLSMSLLMTLPMCLYLASTGGFLLRWLLRSGAGLILYGVYLTNSRGAILGLGAMMFVYSVFRYGLVRSALVLPLLGVPLILLAPSRMSEMSAEEDSAAGRIEAWYEGFQMLRSSPLFGIGSGLFTEHHHLTAHSSYMLTISELGLLGYYVWLSILVLAVMMVWRVFRFTPPAETAATPAIADPGAPIDYSLPDERPAQGERAPWTQVQAIARSLLYSTVAILVCMLFLSRSYTIILYVQIGLIVAIYQMARQGWPEMPPVTWGENWRRLLAISLSTVVLLYLATRFLL